MTKEYRIIIIGLLSFMITGCSAQSIKDALYDEVKISNVSDQRAKNSSESSKEIEVKQADLGDEEIDALLEKVSLLRPSDVADNVIKYNEFKNDIDNLARNLTRKGYVDKLNTLQDILDKSEFSTTDSDYDGISDLTELLITKTSPTLKETNGISDGKDKYTVSYVSFINEKGALVDIKGKLSSYFIEGLNKKSFETSYDEYVVVNARVYGEEIDSLRVITEHIPEIDKLTNKMGFVFPVPVRLTGLQGISIDGNIEFYHRNYEELTNEKSIIFTVGMDNNSLNKYLKRTSTSTKTVDKIYLDKYNSLIFPK